MKKTFPTSEAPVRLRHAICSLVSNPAEVEGATRSDEPVPASAKLVSQPTKNKIKKLQRHPCPDSALPATVESPGQLRTRKRGHTPCSLGPCVYCLDRTHGRFSRSPQVSMARVVVIGSSGGGVATSGTSNSPGPFYHALGRQAAAAQLSLAGIQYVDPRRRRRGIRHERLDRA